MTRRTFQQLCAIVICSYILFCTPQPAPSAPLVVRMGLEQNPPLASISASGKAEGLFVDLMDEIARQENWQIDYISCQLSSCLTMLENHELDLMAPLAWSPDRAQRFTFSSSDIVTNWGVIYSRPNAHIHSFLDLQGRRVGGVTNDIHFQRLKEQLKSFGVTVSYQEYPSFDAVFKSLEQGTVDTGVVGRFFAMKRATAYQIEATPIIFNPIHVHLAFSTETDKQLIAAANQQLEVLKAQPDSVYYRSLEHWLTANNSTGMPFWLKALFWSLSGASLLMITFILLLRRSVAKKTKKLQESQLLLQELIDNTFQFQGLLTPDGTLLDANKSSLAFIDLHKNAVVGKKFWDTPWWQHDPQLQHQLQGYISLAAQGETVRDEVTHCDPTGQLHYVDFTLKPVKDGLGQVIYLIPEGRDITQLKVAEAALREKNSFMETIFNSIPFGLWVRDREGRLVMQNQLNADHYGGVLGSTLQQLPVSPQISKNWSLHLDQVLQGESLDIEMREGEQVYRKIVVPISESGQVTSLFGLNIDVTERYRMLEQLHDSERRFRVIFDEAPFIITLKDMQSSAYLDVNRYYCQFNNVSRHEVIGKTPTEVGHFISPEEHQRIANQLLENGSVEIQNIAISRADGEQRFGLISCRIVRIGGKPCNLTVIQDITNLKKAEDALQAKDHQLLQLIDRAPMGIAMTDGVMIRYANDGFARMIGFNSSIEPQGQPVASYFAPEWQATISDRAARRMRGEQVPVCYEAVGRRLDGSLFPVQLSVVALHQQGEPHLLVFFQDLTDQKRQRDLLIQNEKMLMIGGLAAGMAHEINNPLGIIAQDLQNLERRLSPALAKNNQTAAELGLDLHVLQQYLVQRDIPSYLSSIREAIRRTSRIIDNMLQFSRKSGTGFQLAPLHEIMNHAIELARGDYELRKKYDFPGIALQRAYAQDLPPLPVNVTEIEQVLINLLKNAAQAMADWPGVRRISITTQREADYALLTLCDSGPGMSEETRLRIFDPFFTTKPVGSGTGLGMSVSHAIITKNHKGSITVDSSPGHGCCFTIRLPLVQDAIHAD